MLFPNECFLTSKRSGFKAIYAVGIWFLFGKRILNRERREVARKER